MPLHLHLILLTGFHVPQLELNPMTKISSLCLRFNSAKTKNITVYQKKIILNLCQFVLSEPESCSEGTPKCATRMSDFESQMTLELFDFLSSWSLNEKHLPTSDPLQKSIFASADTAVKNSSGMGRPQKN